MLGVGAELKRKAWAEAINLTRANCCAYTESGTVARARDLEQAAWPTPSLGPLLRSSS